MTTQTTDQNPSSGSSGSSGADHERSAWGYSMACDMLESARFWTSDECPLKARVHPGDGSVMLIAGDNASGKSLFVEWLRAWANAHHKVRSISVSIRERTASGLSEMAGMRKSMMFGSEDEQSTGATSARVVQTAFRTLEQWIGGLKPALMVLDEPEIGLSDAYACAMGKFIAQRVNEIDNPLAMVAVVTHHRGLAREMSIARGKAPVFAYLGDAAGDDDIDFDRWLSSQAQKSVEDLLALAERDGNVRRQVWALDKALKAAKASPG